MSKSQAEINAFAKNTKIGSIHTLFEFCWSDILGKCLEATPEQIENLRHLARDILDPLEAWWGQVKITQGIRDSQVYQLLVARHQKKPNLYTQPSPTSHHFNGNAVDISHPKIEHIFNWIMKEGYPVRENRLYMGHLHLAQFPIDMRRVKDCR